MTVKPPPEKGDTMQFPLAIKVCQRIATTIEQMGGAVIDMGSRRQLPALW